MFAPHPFQKPFRTPLRSIIVIYVVNQLQLVQFFLETSVPWPWISLPGWFHLPFHFLAAEGIGSLILSLTSLFIRPRCMRDNSCATPCHSQPFSPIENSDWDSVVMALGFSKTCFKSVTLAEDSGWLAWWHLDRSIRWMFLFDIFSWMATPIRR